MKVMVTGATGLLGQAVMQALEKERVTCRGISRADADLRDGDAVRAIVQAWRPDVIVHCAAYTEVDRAENDINQCVAVNSLGTLHIARAAQEVGAKLLYVSTDYIFGGDGEEPHAVDDKPQPATIYGLTKLQGEEAIRGVMSQYFILRTSWLFGHGGRSFVQTMQRLGQEKTQVRVVADQIGSPTYAPDLAQVILRLIRTDRYGVYHATNEGYCSFADLASAVLRGTGSKCRVVPVTTEEYGAAAKRPLNSRLSKKSLDAAGILRLPIWEDALRRYLTDGE